MPQHPQALFHTTTRARAARSRVWVLGGNAIRGYCSSFFSENRFALWRVAAFTLLLLVLIIEAAWLGTVIHEVLGHCLMYLAFGGTAYGFGIELFGGGWASGEFHTEQQFAWFVHDFGGILINIISGLLIFVWARKGIRGSVWPLSLCVFVLISVLGMLGYACIGLYYDIGDPAGWAGQVPDIGRYLFLPFLLAAPFGAYVLMAPFVTLQQRLFPCARPLERVCFACLTLGVAAGLFIPLHLMANSTHRIDFPELAQDSARERVLEQKTKAVREKIQDARPELSTEEVEQAVAATPIEVTAEEAHVGPWIVILFLVLMIAGGLAALWVGPPGEASPLPSLKAKALIFPVAILAAGLWIFAAYDCAFALPRFGQGLPHYEGAITEEIVAADWDRYPFRSDGQGALWYTDRYSESENGMLVRFDPSNGTRTILLSNLNEPYLVGVVGAIAYFFETDETDNRKARLMAYDLAAKSTKTFIASREWRGPACVTPEGRIFEGVRRELTTVLANGEASPFAELPLDVAGEIRHITAAPHGSLWVAAAQPHNERDVLVRFSVDDATCAVVAKGLSRVTCLDANDAGNVFATGKGFSALMFVRAAGTGQAWELCANTPAGSVGHAVAAAGDKTIYYSVWDEGWMLRRLTLDTETQ